MAQGVAIAQQHIARLRDNPHWNSSWMGHALLGEDGCATFFKWLIEGDDEYPEEFPRSLAYLELYDVGMGDVGFQALVTWLEKLKEKPRDEADTPITKINLRSNNICGTADQARAFVNALSSPTGSTLSSLILSNNLLSAPFRGTLMSLLPSLPSLRSLFLSMTGLTTSDAISLAAFIASPSCKLLELHANANSMKSRGVRAIVGAIRMCWTLERVELYSNELDEDEEDEDAPDDSQNKDLETENPTSTHTDLAIHLGLPPEALDFSLSSSSEVLKFLATRNLTMKRQVVQQAFYLLRYSRTVLLPGTGSGNRKKEHRPTATATPESTNSSQVQEYSSSSDVRECASDVSPSPSPLSNSRSLSSLPSVGPSTQSSTTAVNASVPNLPMEIKLAILSRLAPCLSFRQRLRIFEYASDCSTLPKLNDLPPAPEVSTPPPTTLPPSPTSLRERYSNFFSFGSSYLGSSCLRTTTTTDGCIPNPSYLRSTLVAQLTGIPYPTFGLKAKLGAYASSTGGNVYADSIHATTNAAAAKRRRRGTLQELRNERQARYDRDNAGGVPPHSHSHPLLLHPHPHLHPHPQPPPHPHPSPPSPSSTSASPTLSTPADRSDSPEPSPAIVSSVAEFSVGDLAGAGRAVRVDEDKVRRTKWLELVGCDAYDPGV